MSTVKEVRSYLNIGGKEIDIVVNPDIFSITRADKIFAFDGKICVMNLPDAYIEAAMRHNKMQEYPMVPIDGFTDTHLITKGYDAKLWAFHGIDIQDGTNCQISFLPNNEEYSPNRYGSASQNQGAVWLTNPFNTSFVQFVNKDAFFIFGLKPTAPLISIVSTSLNQIANYISSNHISFDGENIMDLLFREEIYVNILMGPSYMLGQGWSDNQIVVYVSKINPYLMPKNLVADVIIASPSK